jgi:hypothetical protein
MNHEIAIKIKRKEWEEKITLRWFASLVGCCSTRMVFSPCPPWLWGFFLEEEDERDEMMKVCMSGFAEHRRAILLAVEMHQDW